MKPWANIVRKDSTKIIPSFNLYKPTGRTPEPIILLCKLKQSYPNFNIKPRNIHFDIEIRYLEIEGT